MTRHGAVQARAAEKAKLGDKDGNTGTNIATPLASGT